MKKVFIAKGYNSYTNKALIKAFRSEAEADQFIQGLTDPKIDVIAYRSLAELVNSLLGA